MPLAQGAGPDALKDLPSRLRAARAALAADLGGAAVKLHANTLR